MYYNNFFPKAGNMGVKYPLKAVSKLSWKIWITLGGGAEGGGWWCQKTSINMSVMNSWITAVHWLAFQMKIVVLSVSCIMGRFGVFLAKRIQMKKEKGWMSQWSQDPLQDIIKYSQIYKMFYDVAIGVRLYKIYEFVNIFVFLEKHLLKNSSIFLGTKTWEVQFTPFPLP